MRDQRRWSLTVSQAAPGTAIRTSPLRPAPSGTARGRRCGGGHAPIGRPLQEYPPPCAVFGHREGFPLLGTKRVRFVKVSDVSRISLYSDRLICPRSHVLPPPGIRLPHAELRPGVPRTIDV